MKANTIAIYYIYTNVYNLLNLKATLQITHQKLIRDRFSSPAEGRTDLSIYSYSTEPTFPINDLKI